ncbi:MAG: autotransporter-associated beta strand repeat-containing protein [Kiritimatiellae bacterium]|nr:autotransporter-associated beta strand repeat-containing protein [Kiritimatiellia bacterium]
MKINSLWCLVLACVWTAQAEVLTWRGTAGGGDGATFSAAANWADGSEAARAPQPGDTLVVDKNATITSSVDLGSEGYTIDVASGIKCYINGKISGTGQLVKDGLGELFLENGANDYSGGNLILKGVLETDIGSAKGVPFGTGDIEIRRTAKTKCYLQTYHVNVTNNILITGPYTSTSYQALDFCQETKYSGKVTCDADVAMFSHYQNSFSEMAGVYDMHGHTIHMTFRNANTRNGDMKLSGVFDCSYEKVSSRDYLFTTGKFVDPDASYTIHGGTNYLDAGASIACTNVVLDGATYPACFYFNSESVLSEEATVKLNGDAKLYVCAGLYVAIGHLVVNGEELEPGSYTAATLPTVIDGAGTVLVSASYTWTGAVSKAWNEPANWSPQGVPGSGDHVFFKSADTLSRNLKENIDIGEKGLVSHNLGGDVQLYGSFFGSGALTCLGNKRLFLCMANKHTGGTVVSCELWQYATDTMGSGPVEIRRAGGSGVSYIPCVASSTAENNDITVTGAYGGSSERTFQFGNSSGISGTITATDDVSFFGRYIVADIGGNIACTLNAHGHTAHFSNQINSGVYCHQTLSGCFDANIETSATVAGCVINVTGRFVDPDASYTINGCTNIIESSAQIACTNIVVNNSAKKDAYLWFRGDNVFPVAPSLTVSNGGKVRVDDGLTVHLDKLIINGTVLGKGAYTAQTHPEIIEGAGRLRVGYGGFTAYLH